MHAHGDRHGIVCVWGFPGMPDDRRVHPLGGNRDKVRVAMSPDGRYIVPSGFWRNRYLWTTRVYEIRSGEPAGPWMDVDGGLNDSVFSPDGTRLVTLSSRPENRLKTNAWVPLHVDPGRIRFWDWRTGKQARPALETPSEPVYASYRPDGNLLAVLCAGGEILSIDPATGQVGMQLDQGEKHWRMHTRAMVGVVWFASDGRHLVAGGLHKIVRVWEPATGRLCHTFEHKDLVDAVALSRDEQFLAIGTTGVCVRNVTTGKRVGVDLAHPNAVRFVDFSPDGRHLLTACSDGMVRVWDWRAGRLACSALEHEGAAYCARFSSDGRWILATGEGGCMRVWEWQTGKQVTPAKVLPGGRGCMILVTPDGKYAGVTGLRRVISSFVRDPGLGIATFDLRDLAQPPHHQLSLLELRTLSEIISTRRVEGSGTTRMTLDEWFERWHSFRKTCPTHHNLDDFKTTISDFAKEVRLAQREDRTFREQAEASYKAGDYEGAVAALTHAIDLRPDDVNALTSRGSVFCYGLSRLKEAIADYTKAVQLDPDYGHAYSLRATVRCRTGQLEEALADASRSIQLSTEDPDLVMVRAGRHYARADVLALLGRWEGVVEDFSKYVDYVRSSEMGWSRHALMRLHLAGVDEYRRVCGELMERFGKTKEPLSANSVAWSCALGPKAVPDMTQCVALAEAAVAAKPENAAVRNTLGAILYRNGDFAAAVEQLNKSIELRGGRGVPGDWLFLAMSHQRLGHPDEARQWLDKVKGWISRVELKVLHIEAESLLSGSAPEGQKDAYGVVKDPERLKTIIKKLDDALETSFRKASSAGK